MLRPLRTLLTISSNLCSRLTLFTDKFQLKTALKAPPFAGITHSHALGVIPRLAIVPVLILASTRAIRPHKPVAAVGAGPGALAGWVCPQAEPSTPVLPDRATIDNNTNRTHL